MQMHAYNPLTNLDDPDVDIEEEYKKLSKKSKKIQKNFRVALGLIFLLSSACAIQVVVLYKLKPQTPLAPTQAPKICASKSCKDTARYFLTLLKEDVDPCADFYKFTCGRLSSEKWKETDFQNIATSFFESSPKVSEPRMLKEARKFYSSCIRYQSESFFPFNLFSENLKGNVSEYLSIMGLPKVPTFFSKDDKTITNWIKIETALKKQLAKDVFIGFKIELRNQNETGMIISSPYLEFRAPYEIKDVLQKYYLEYQNQKDDNYENESLNSAVLKIDEIRRELSSIFSNSMDFNDAFNAPLEGLTVEDLQTETDDASLEFSWKNYFDHLFEDTNVVIDAKKDRVYMTSLTKSQILNMLRYVSRLSPIDLELYFWWVTANQFEYDDNPRRLSYFFLDDRTTCSNLINYHMNLATTYILANNERDSKAKAEKMLKQIRNALIDEVENFDWMDSESKQAILLKNEKLISYVEYPDWLFDEQAFDDYYEKYYNNMDFSARSLSKNLFMILQNDYNQMLKSLRRDNKNDWKMQDPTILNAFYYAFTNSIRIPWAITKFPMFHLGLDALDYGALGSILGHEVIHGYDQNRIYDAFGNLKRLWTEGSDKNYTNLLDCFINQYMELDLYKARDTLEENLSDNGGVNLAFKAYKKSVKQNGEEAKLIGFDSYSNDQLFFIAFASVWCTSDPNYDYDSVHASNFVRVSGTLQNSAAFSEAFHCAKGSYMNPNREKCKIW